MSTLKSSKFQLIIYDSSNIEKLNNYVKSFGGYYAFIKHDRDINDDLTFKKIHYHYIIVFPSNIRKTFQTISKISCVEINLIEKVNNITLAIQYLTHKNEDENDSSKIKYSYNEIISNDETFTNYHYNTNITYLDNDKTLQNIEILNYIYDMVLLGVFNSVKDIIIYLRSINKLTLYQHYKDLIKIIIINKGDLKND